MKKVKLMPNNNRRNGSESGVKTLQHKGISVLFATIVFFVMFSAGITLAYFTSTASLNGASMSFASLDTLVSANGQAYGDNVQISVNGVTAGTKLVQTLKVKTDSGSINGLLRVKVGYQGASNNQISQNVAIALNSDLTFATYADTASGYKWVECNGYYYLTDTSGKLKECVAGSEYTLFSGTDTVYFPDVDKYNLSVTNLNGVTFTVRAEAVQSYKLADSVTDVSALDALIAEHSIFDAEEPLGYIIRFNTLSESTVPSIIVRGQDVTLPTVNGISVEWFDSFSAGAYGTSVGRSGGTILNGNINGNKTYYAKYEQTKITILFASDGADSGTLPNSTTIDYASTGNAEIAVTTDLTKTGYTYTKWTTTVNGTSRDFTVSNGKISVPKNITTAGNAITIMPKWEVITYTATFLTNGVTISSTWLTYDSTLRGYKGNYTVNDIFTFPSIEKEESAFMGWKVTSAVADTKWRVEDTYIAGKIGKDYYGNVTFTASWGELAFKESASSETVLLEVSKTYGEENFTIFLSNSTGVQATFASSNANVAKIVDSNYGTVKLVGAGSCVITASVQLAGMTSTTSYTLNVAQRAISSAIVGAIADQTYTGSAIQAKPQITDLSAVLTEGKDYTLTFANNTSIGTATITIAGMGNYKGSTSTTFKIVAKDISTATITLSAFNTYNGTQQEQGVTSVKVGGLTVPNYTITGNKQTNAGKYTLTITASGNFKGSASIEYQILQRNINNASISGLSSKTYTGSEITQGYTVTDSVPTSGTTLVLGTDYSGAFTNNKVVGNATLTITGIGNYTGTKTANFAISPANITGSITQSGTLVYTGSAQTPSLNKNITTQGGQAPAYTYSTAQNGTYGSSVPTFTARGTHTLYYKVNAQYHNELGGSCTITIGTRNIGANEIVITVTGSYTYTGSAITPAYTVKDTLESINKTLTAGTDYETKSVTNNINAGTATLTIAGKGDYVGDKSVTFSIGNASITGSITQSGTLTYTGSAQTPNLNWNITTKGGQTPNYTYSTSSSGAYSASVPTFTNQGTHTLYYKVNATYHNELSGSCTITIGVLKVAKPTASGTYTYNGASQTVSIATSSWYTITGNTGTNAGSYTATVTLNDKSNTTWSDGTTGNLSLGWSIGARNINASEISIAISSSHTYTGSAQTPTYSVRDTLSTINKTLSSSTDYTGATTNNTNVGTATLTVTGKGNYTGTKTANFAISKANITGSITQSGTLTYTGSAQTPNLNRNITTKGGQTPSYTYSTSSSGSYSTSVPTYTSKGTYTLYYKVNATYHNELSGSCTITVSALTLSTPTNLSWTTGTASWKSVTGASNYSVALYNGSSLITTVVVATNSCDFSSNLKTTASTSWTFKVTATTSNANYANSSQSGVSSAQSTYSIAYNANGGSGSISTQYKINGENITLSTTKPTRSGYEFKGWATSSGATSATYSAGATYTANSSATLYAVWELAEISLTVTNTTSYYNIGGSLYSKASSSTYYKCSGCGDYSTSSTRSGSCSSTYHSRSTKYYCSKCGYVSSSTCYHTSYYHSGSLQTTKYHSGTLKTTYGSHAWEIDTMVEPGGYIYYCPNCKDSYIEEEGEPSGGCPGNATTAYSCCGGASGSTGCKSSRSYSCCGGASGSSGCKSDSTNYASKRYVCNTCGNSSTSSSSGTGCYHTRNSVGYKYTKQYGSGDSTTYSSEPLSTGYYWHSTYGALKVGDSFTYSDGYAYEVTAISGTTLTARRKT